METKLIIILKQTKQSIKSLFLNKKRHSPHVFYSLTLFIQQEFLYELLNSTAELRSLVL